jgi:hypothetical protein
VKKLAKLALFFSLNFVILFLVATGLRFLAIRAEWVRTLSHERETVLLELIGAARWALSLGLYGGVLLGLSYAVRKAVFAPTAILCIALLAVGFTFGIDTGLKNWGNVPPVSTPLEPLGRPGLILANTARPDATVLVLLQGPAEPGGRRVVLMPDKPLLYQAEFSGMDHSLISVPPAPFSNDTPWFLQSLAIDIQLNAENLRQLLDEGFVPFLIYAGALIFLLSSPTFLFKFSVWPLANLFLGCLAFRGVLALETFFNAPEMQDVFASLLQNRLPLPLAVPIIFTGVGLLIHLYSFLVFLVKRQSDYAF